MWGWATIYIYIYIYIYVRHAVLAQLSGVLGEIVKFPMSSHMYINMFMFLLLKHASAKSLVTLVTRAGPIKTRVFAKCGFALVFYQKYENDEILNEHKL